MMSRRAAHGATSPVQGVAGGVARWAVSAPLRGTLPFARARARTHARPSTPPPPPMPITMQGAWHHTAPGCRHGTTAGHQPHRPLPLTTLARAFDHCLPPRLPPPHLADPKPCALPVPELLPCLGIGLRVGLCCCGLPGLQPPRPRTCALCALSVHTRLRR